MTSIKSRSEVVLSQETIDEFYKIINSSEMASGPAGNTLHLCLRSIDAGARPESALADTAIALAKQNEVIMRRLLDTAMSQPPQRIMIGSISSFGGGGAGFQTAVAKSARGSNVIDEQFKDVVAYGQSNTKDGERVDPKDFCKKI